MKSQICKLLIVAAVLTISVLFFSPVVTTTLSASFMTVFMSDDGDDE